jgi:STE24 endopeptidase
LGWSTARAASLRARPPNAWRLGAAFGVVFFRSFQIFELPLSFYSGYVLPHRFGLSTQTLAGWLRDLALEWGLTGVLGLPVLEGAYWLLRAAGPQWWLWAGAGATALTVVLSGLAPTLLLPLFNKYVPLGAEHAELVQRLQRLAEQAGTRISGVFRFDMSRRTTAANAALTGLGATRRIILGDTLLESFTPDEIETVIAHELGHHVHRDIPVGLVISSALTFVGLFLAAQTLGWGTEALGYAGPADIAGLPLLALVLGVFGALTLPLNNAYSRWREVRADRFALAITGKPRAFTDAMTRLANQNLAEADPEPWVVFLLYSHPPIRDRLALAAGSAGGARA